MNKEQVLELMNAVPPDLIEEAGVQAPARRPLPRLVRAGLIAACLCAAAVGTAFAAANPEAVADFIRRFTPVYIQSASLDSGAKGYEISFEPARYPIDCFSPALLAAGEDREDRGVTLEFDTWEETRAFIGEDIPCVMPDFVTGRDEPFHVHLSYDGQDRLARVSVFAYGPLPVVELIIYTEYSYADDAGMSARTTFVESADQSEVLAPYQMANGCEAQIALIASVPLLEEPGDGYAHCSATFVRDGVLYTVTSVAHRASDEHLLSTLYEALDSFQ